jgi:hypothetical protein
MPPPQCENQFWENEVRDARFMLPEALRRFQVRYQFRTDMERDATPSIYHLIYHLN